MSSLVHIHSILRWLVLATMIYAIIRAIRGKQLGVYEAADNQASLFAMISCDIQLLIGLVLYVAGPMGIKNIQENGMKFVMSNAVSRFFAVEHLSMMLIALVLVHVGRARSKKLENDAAKHQAVFVFYTIALVLILASIPWPFREAFAGRSWF
jgi:hypothetical protein